MLTRLTFVCALALLLPPIHEAVAQHGSALEHRDASVYTLPEGGQPARIPFQFVGNQVRLDATIQGKGPFRLVLDTGMPMGGVLLFQNERVRALELDAQDSPVQVAGAGGDGKGSQARMASDLSVTLGDLKVTKTTALLVERPPGFPPAIDGIIGGALFFHHVVRVDMDQGRLEVRAPSGWSPPDGACVVPLVRERGLAFLDLSVAVGDEDPIPARVVIDLGAGHALSLNEREDGRFAPPKSAIEAPLGRGMSGVILGKVGRVRRVELGTFAFEHVVASFPAGDHQKPGGGEFRDGNLGKEILRRFNLTFDYEGNRLVLEKAKGYDEPFEREMAGIAFDWEPDGTASVRGVLAGSPAATAGIQAGDRLIAIDGKPMADVGENGLRKSLTVEGVERLLTLVRGNETLEKRVRLKRLV